MAMAAFRRKRLRMLAAGAVAGLLLGIAGCSNGAGTGTTAGTAAPGASSSPGASTPSRLGSGSSVASTAPSGPTTGTGTGPGDQPAGGPVPAGFAATSVTFVSEDEAFVLGTAPCAQAPCTSIVRTLDRGASWVGLPAPIVPVGEPAISSAPA